ncbi:RNA metabolism protein [Lithospermum erythrorhizon]|uniref:RNA metabolism protein n=1 Tax=Lithospermum erythrorhizon TaxID=34254 RepID=A0AAV3PBI6_LITER
MATPSEPSPPRGCASSPWVHIVRGTESTAPNVVASIVPPSIGTVSEKIVEVSADDRGLKPLDEEGNGSGLLALSGEGGVGSDVQLTENGGGSNAGKKPVWNRVSTLNGEGEVSPVMGAVSWPALSESAKVSTKPAYFEPLKLVSDGSTSDSQGTRVFSPSSHRQVIGSNANPSSNPNHVAPIKKRPNRRGNGGGSVNSSNNMPSNGGFSQAPPPQGMVGELTPNNRGKSSLFSGETSAKENTHIEGVGESGEPGSQSPSGRMNQQRSSYRRGSSGPHNRDGSQHHSHGGRRDQDRGNQDWNPHRNFGSRDAQMQPQRGSSRPFFRGPPHSNTTFIVPSPIAVRPPFVAPMIYPGPEVLSPVFYPPGPHLDPFRPVPLVAPVGPVYYPFGDPHLHMKIVNQIEYYFSNENLVKDTFLRKNMDEQGWVPIKLIAGFKLVSQLTDDMKQIVAALQSSIFLELDVKGEKVRRRDDWPNWIMPRSAQHSAASSPQSTLESGNDILAKHLQSLGLNENDIPSRSSSGELSSR